MEEGNFTQPVQQAQPTESIEPVAPETPVDPVPTAPIEPIMPNDNKKLNNKVLIILGIVVVAVIAIVAIVFAMNSGNKTEETQQNTSNSEQETKKKPNKDTVVRDVITGLNDSLDAYLKKEKVSTELEQIYDQVIPIYKSSSKVAIPLEKSYGLKSSADISTSVSDDLVLETKEYLTDSGFKLYKDVELTGEQKQYLNKDTGVLCYVVDGVPFSVACGHIDWVTADNSALIDSLAEAYKAVEGEYPLFIGATKKNIQDSPFEPYQKLQVNLPGAAGLFYRPSATADWVFFAATQAVISCEKYESDAGARKAFQGEKCYDEAAKENRTVTNGTTKDETEDTTKTKNKK